MSDFFYVISLKRANEVEDEATGLLPEWHEGCQAISADSKSVTSWDYADECLIAKGDLEEGYPHLAGFVGARPVRRPK